MPRRRSAAVPTASIQLNLFSGRREPLKLKSKVLVTLLDGNQKQVHRDHHSASSIVFKDLPFSNNFIDNYTVVASASKHEQVGFTPVPISPQMLAPVDLMLLSNDPSFDFSEAKWEVLRTKPEFDSILTSGVSSESAGRDRYTDVLENRPEALACLLNILTAMQQIHLRSGTPVTYLRELIWDESMEPDRFYGWVSTELVPQVEHSAAEGHFEPEPGAALFHPGATRSYKQKQFGEANVQITLHENDTRTIKGIPCVKVEFDIDYYKDPLAHALLEVVYHRLTGAATDPRQVYVLRWVAGRRAGMPDFNPPYRLV
jgi:hypothetical protein